MLPSRKKRVARSASVAGKRKVLDITDALAKRARRKQARRRNCSRSRARGIVNQLIAGEKPRMVRRPSEVSRQKTRKKR
jgi:hypothetical protein